MIRRLLPSIVIFTSLFSAAASHAVTFSGRAASDFPAGACITDPSIDSGGQDVQFVVAGAIRTSGFDATKLCISYDAASDTVQVGTLTHNNAANTEIITGDADGNGDPATVSSDLSGSGVQDIANFGSKEFFSLLLDFDFAVNNGFSIVAGKHSDAALTDYNVFTAASSNLDNTGTSAMYGTTEGAAIGSATFASPSSSAPHLEFSIAHFKSIPSLALDWTDPNDTIGLYFTMGSYSDGAIGEELFPSKLDARIFYRFYPLTVAHLLQIDADGDGIIDDLDKDDDGDGISDLIEMGLKACDLDGDGILSVSQDKDSDNLFDAGEEGEILKCAASGFSPGGKDILRKAAFPGGKYPDFDGDGTPNYLDTDSDNDGVLDKDEDKNGNGVVDTGETNPLDTDSDDDGISDLDEFNKFKTDTDGDGLSDGEEVETYKTDPLKPDTDADDLKDGDEVKLHGTDPLNPDTDGGGARDGLEVQRSTNPLDPSDDQKALIDPNNIPETAVGPGQTDAGTIDPDLAGYATDEVHLSGSGLTSCSLATATDHTETPYIYIVVMLALLFSLSLRERVRACPRGFKRGVRGTYSELPLSPTLPRRGREIVALLVFGASLFTTPAHALNVQLERLPMNGYGGLFQDNTQMLGQYNWNVAIGFDYTRKPLQFSLISSGRRLDNVVDYFVTQDTSIAFGLADWLDIGVAIQSDLPSRVEPVGATTSSTKINFGDLLISAKFQLIDPVEEKHGLGLALIPFVTLPTGNDSRFIGNSGMTGGFKVVGERYFGRTDVYATLGALFRGTENLPINLSVGSAFLFGLGVQHPIWTAQDLHLLVEFDGSTTFDKFLHQENTSPVQMNAGIRKYWADRLVAATVSAGTGVDSGYGSPQFRAMAGLSYMSAGTNDRDDDTVKDPEDYCPTRIAPTVPNTIDLSVVPVSSMASPLDMTPPGCPNPNVIVKVVGDRILILRPINFDTGAATITADSTIVVDQVAVLLKSSPELQKILVEGHTDTVGGATYNQKLSEDRAKAVTDALVARGVAASRLTSRGWGLTKPLTTNATETGRAKNRRVEFHIVEFKKQ